MEKKKFIPVKELKVYQLARQLSTKAWLIYSKMSFEDKKHIGDQFIRSVDSVGANIAEGYYRFYYLDKCRFYYNSRASLAEAMEHWLELLLEREKISKILFDEFSIIYKDLQVRLNNFIKETKDENQNKDKAE
jgi:four helix bundle protein